MPMTKGRDSAVLLAMPKVVSGGVFIAGLVGLLLLGPPSTYPALQLVVLDRKSVV